MPTFILSLKVSFSAVSGAIFTTLAPLPLKNARSVPAQECSISPGASCCMCAAVSCGTRYCLGTPIVPALLKLSDRCTVTYGVSHGKVQACVRPPADSPAARTLGRHLAEGAAHGEPAAAVRDLHQHLEPVDRRRGRAADRPRDACNDIPPPCPVTAALETAGQMTVAVGSPKLLATSIAWTQVLQCPSQCMHQQHKSRAQARGGRRSDQNRAACSPTLIIQPVPLA